MTPFEAYKLYVALKNHFNSKTYDFVKYNGKVNAKRESFDKRRDRFFFEKLAKHEDPKSFLIANFLVNKNGWIKDLSYGDEPRRIYESWVKRQQSLSYVVQDDVSRLDEDFDSNFKVEPNTHPKALKKYLMKEISLETLTILCDMVGCMKYWDRSLENDPLWEDLSVTIRKYLSFLQYDRERVRQVCIDTFSM